MRVGLVQPNEKERLADFFSVLLGKHEPMPFGFRHRTTKLSRRIDPELNSLIDARKRLFLRRAVSHASRKFRHFSNTHLILIAPIDNDLVFMQ